jgi:hypothetical protein
MARITQIDVRIETGDRAGAGTDGQVFLGLCGKELLLDRRGEKGADFEPEPTSKPQRFRLGKVSNSLFPQRSDPRKHSLDTGDLDKYPIYIRFEPKDNGDTWNAEGVGVTVNPDSTKKRYAALLKDEENLWLGKAHGRYWFLLERYKR